ncbi:hypothetical protein NQ176_g4798 [Zarea fungicola]|uniref:Uncharacterized protein n=1 Tax=Zarea fungicola TaxID=93591 RepID=A0ACC1NE31_9HYPO|nr:hypothetical protein NQ176_g4798 [Lecanicillium fungicola]
MANRELFFFYAPTWDFHPEAIKLGNVITSVKKPQRPLCCCPPPPEGRLVTQKKSVRFTREKLYSGKFSLWTSFLNVVGLKVDLRTELDKTDETDFVFETIDTTQFTPTPSYTQSCLEDADVRHFLKLSRYRKPVYIVTGIKIATGAAKTLQARTVGGAAGVSVDTSLWTASPISGGPGVEGKAGRKESTEWDSSSPFVFAFSVSRVWASKATGQVVGEEQYRKGAMLGDDAEEGGQEEGDRVSIAKIEQVDAQAEGLDAEELMEDEDTVLCIRPKEEDSSD